LKIKNNKLIIKINFNLYNDFIKEMSFKNMYSTYSNIPSSVSYIKTTQYVPRKYTEYIPVERTSYAPVTSIQAIPTPTIRNLPPKFIRNQLPPQVRTVMLQPRIIRSHLPPIGPSESYQNVNYGNEPDLLGEPVYTISTEPIPVSSSLRRYNNYFN